MTPRPPHSPHPRRLWAALGLALLAVSCGSADGAVTAGSGPGQAPLPTLPSIAERNPGQFVDGGCSAVPEGADCSVTAAQIDEAQAGANAPADGWRTLAGFVGNAWSTETTGAVVVLTETVSTSTDGMWAATGLVRNQTATTVGNVVVDATLLDSSGASLGVVTGAPAVSSLRPGEPGPFEVQATIEVPSTSVASVRWTVRSEPLPMPPNRDLELSLYWQRGLADARPVDMYLHHDPTSGARPLVVFGAVSAVGSSPITAMRVVGAWTDSSGRVIALADATLGLTGQPVEQVDIAAGTSADFVLTIDAAGAPVGLDEASLMLWGTGS